MNTLLAIPLPLRLAALGVLGLIVGGQLNRGIYRLAYRKRAIGPWSAPHPDASRRSLWDRVPLLGWIGLRREAPIHGRGYWVRPILIELACGVSLPVLYWYETVAGGLYPPGLPLPSADVLHAQWFAHVVLFGLLLVATFIDFDEKTIPDEITINGAAIGVVLAALLPAALLPTVVVVDFVPRAENLVLTASTHHPEWQDGLGGPQSWPPALDETRGLGYGLAALVAWYLAVIPKLWTTRRGLRKAFVYMGASIIRYRSWLFPTLIFAILLATVLAAYRTGGVYWEAVLTSLVGMVFAGGLTWMVRVVATVALQVEAMGFGDVTLMAMIGAFLGWQPSVLTFFLAPFAAVLIAVALWLLTRRKDIAFGPYLSLAAVVVVLQWDRIWRGWAEEFFSLGWFLPAIIFFGLILMGGLLWLWRLFRDAVFGG